MNPCELNALIAAISNYLFINLSKKDFLFLNILLSELSKSMFTMELLKGVCRIDEKNCEAENLFEKNS